MAERSRGVALTIFAILFGLLAVSNFLKPVMHGGNFVFLGTKTTGAANAIFSILFGIILAVFAYGIWAMRRFALVIAYFYFPWVLLNMILFAMKNKPTDSQPSPLATVATIAIGVGVPLAALIILYRRRAELT
jgi:NADH:ubiquinone oxidoreductase subunit K